MHFIYHLWTDSSSSNLKAFSMVSNLVRPDFECAILLKILFLSIFLHLDVNLSTENYLARRSEREFYLALTGLCDFTRIKFNNSSLTQTVLSRNTTSFSPNPAPLTGFWRRYWHYKFLLSKKNLFLGPDLPKRQIYLFESDTIFH